MGFTFNDIYHQFEQISEIMHENEAYLIKLDAAIGDGDLGLTMSRGFKAGVEFLKENSDQVDDLGKVLMQAGMAINNAAPSTMGTLISSAVMGAGRVARGLTEIDDSTYIEMAKAGIQGIKDRGGAEVGDKTILDSLVPGVEALEQDIKRGKSMDEALKATMLAAEAGLESTKDMVSKHGRGHYYGEKSRGHKDPGAAVGYLIFKALQSAVAK